MFTGIVERVLQGEFRGNVLRIRKCWDDVELGESIAVNGVCLTVTQLDTDYMYFDVGVETASRTNLFETSLFNLERALKFGDRVSGHYVTGHVDGTVTLVSRYQLGNSSFFKFSLPKERYAVTEKGSIALNGVSLTVASVDLDTFTVQIIPHTLNNTNLAQLRPGARVNYEIDVFARYVHSILKDTIKGTMRDF